MSESERSLPARVVLPCEGELLTESRMMGNVNLAAVAKCERDGGTPVRESTVTLTDPNSVEDYIAHIDFTLLKEKLTLPIEEGGEGWEAELAEHVEVKYKRWLLMKWKYANVLIPPPMDVDTFWHGHILDTQSYWRDSLALFGKYLHHYPYFGMRGKADRASLEEAFENTLRLYREEYGEDITA
jgi:hypothetical protein